MEKGRRIVIFEIKPMSKEGLRQWNKSLRPFVRRQIYNPLFETILPYSVNNKRRLAEFLYETVGEGFWDIRTGRTIKKKGRKKGSPRLVSIAKIKIREKGEDRFSFTAIDLSGISRYRFWRLGSKKEEFE